MKIEVRLFDELVELFDLERPAEVVRLVKYINFHSRNRRYRLRSGGRVDLVGDGAPLDR